MDSTDLDFRPLAARMHRASSSSRLSRSSRASQLSRASSSRRTLIDMPQEKKPRVFPKSTSSYITDVSLMHPRIKVTNSNYWEHIIGEVEHAVNCLSQPRLPMIDYSMVLPPRLKERVRHIQGYDFSKSDDDIYIREEMIEERPQEYVSENDSDSEALAPEEGGVAIDFGRKKVEEHFNESDHSDIVRMDQEFEKFDLKLDEPVGHTHRTLEKNNWLCRFLCAPREQRVNWRTRVKRRGQKEHVLTLDEQAETLMDASAERFVEWLNAIGSGDATMTPSKVKNLFSIKGDRTLLASVKTDPKEVNAIAKTVADKWNKPHMAIELKYEKHINDHATRPYQKPMLSSFGRTVPLRDRPWVKRSGDTVIETVYPEELLSREKIFKGITHLRSTSALIDFYIANPSLPRPRYLLEGGDFEVKGHNETRDEIPLYEHLGLRY